MERELQKVKIERYSSKKIKQYEANGTPYQLVDKENGRRCFVIGHGAGRNHDEYLIQEDFIYEGDNRHRFYTVSDLKDFRIWTGGIDIEPGDLIRYSWGKSAGQREHAFYYFNHDGLCLLEGRGKLGFGLCCGMDYTGGQFSNCCTFHEVDDEHPIYLAKATDEELEQYKALLAKNGYRLEKDGRIVKLPEIGKCIYLVECSGGKVYVNEHMVNSEDDYELLENKFTFRTKEHAEQVAKRMSEVSTHYYCGV